MNRCDNKSFDAHFAHDPTLKAGDGTGYCANMTVDVYENKTRHWQNWGYVINENDTITFPSTTATGQEMKAFKYDTFASLEFEILVLVLYLLCMYVYFRMKRNIENLRKQQYDVIALKNFEECSESEGEEEMELQIGTSADNRGEDTTEQQKRKNEYKQLMREKVAKKLTRNYIDCDWFVKSNKLFFVLFLVFIMGGAMNYNSLSDIPSLLMILILASFYAFRKQYYLTYGKFVIFMAYFMHIAVLLKIYCVLFFSMSTITDYFKDAEKVHVSGETSPLNEFLKFFEMVFGVNVNDEGSTNERLRFVLEILMLYFI